MTAACQACRPRQRLKQRGAALLAAMLTVTLVATIAAAAVQQQWRSLEVEGAERTRVQAAWLLLGGVDFARHILRQDSLTSGSIDALTEPWSVPLAEARLSTFLQASNNQTNVDDSTIDAAQAFLSGAIVDAQARLNIRNLVDSNALNPKALRQFSRLFERLGLPSSELTVLTQSALAALRGQGASEQAPLAPNSFKELAWWGLSPSTLAAIEPYVTILPKKTPVNINTAPTMVVWAAIDGLDFASAQHIVQSRRTNVFETVKNLAQRYPSNPAIADAVQASAGNNPLLAVSTAYFDVWARLRLDDLVVQERCLVFRQGLKVLTVRRERGATLPSALLGEASASAAGTRP